MPVDAIPQWSTADKVTGFYGQSKFGAGKSSLSDWPIYVCCTGTKTSDGSLTADSDIQQVFSVDEAAAYVGARSMSLQQVKAALEVPGVNVLVCPPLETTGAAATISILFGGSWTSAGTPVFAVNGERVAVTVGSSDDPTDAALAAVAAFGAEQYLPVTSATAGTAETVLLTCASKGTQGNQLLLGWDLTDAPPGMTVTVTGGTPLHDKLVPFSGGAGTENVANIIGIIENEQVDYIASAQNDTTNMQLWRSHVQSEMQPVIGHLESVMCASNGTLAAAGSLAATTLNDVQCVVIWSENCETHPAAIAANAAALRSASVGANPNTVYAGQRLTGVATRRYKEDRPGHNTLMAALNTGLTPLRDEDGYAVIERDCVTKCLNGSTPYYKTYGWPEVDVPFRVRKEDGQIWTDRKEGNPYCGPDTGEGEKTANTGVETPSTLGAALTTRHVEMEKLNWLVDGSATTNPIIVEYDTTRKCLVWSHPVLVKKQNLQAGATIKQVAG